MGRRARHIRIVGHRSSLLREGKSMGDGLSLLLIAGFVYLLVQWGKNPDQKERTPVNRYRPRPIPNHFDDDDEDD